MSRDSTASALLPPINCPSQINGSQPKRKKESEACLPFAALALKIWEKQILSRHPADTFVPNGAIEGRERERERIEKPSGRKVPTGECIFSPFFPRHFLRG